KVDARKLADLLRTGMLRPVYHGEHGLRTLRELGRSYQTLSHDLNRVMNRIKALYRGWSIPCAGTQVYAPRYREEWLGKIEHAGVRRRAELLYQQLDGLQALRRTLRPELLTESRKHKASKLLRQIPCIGPIRAPLHARSCLTTLPDNAEHTLGYRHKECSSRDTELDPIHHSIQILAEGLITAPQLAQCPQSVFPVIDRSQHARA